MHENKSANTKKRCFTCFSTRHSHLAPAVRQHIAEPVKMKLPLQWLRNYYHWIITQRILLMTMMWKFTRTQKVHFKYSATVFWEYSPSHRPWELCCNHSRWPGSCVFLSYPPLLSADVQNVVSSNEGVAVLVFELPVDVLLSLLESNVHVAVKARQYTSVIQTRVQLHYNGTSDDLLQKLAGCLASTHGSDPL